jgi:LCP family protein required for cell wall assembly
MSTLNPDERRSFDGFRRRPNPLSRQPDSPPEAGLSEAVEPEPVRAPNPVVTQPIAPAPAPETPVFEYRKPRRHRKGGWRVARRVTLVVLAVLLVTGGWFGYKAFRAARNIIAKSNGGAPALLGSVDPTKLKGEGDGRINVLVLGIGGQGHEAPNLSDTLLVMSIDPKTKDSAMLSIPRDLYVKLPAVAKYGNQYGKINAANAYGGPEYAAKVVSAVIGVPIHYYILVDFSGFRQAVDAVGGVDINVPKAIYDPEYPCDNEKGGYCPFRVAAGTQHMSGTIALRYARSRKSTSDFDRAARQQQVIAAVREKALQLSTLTNPVKITQLIDTLGSHVKTDFQPNEIAKMANIVKDLDTSKMTQNVLTTDGPDALLNGGTNIIDGAGYIEVPKAGNFVYTDIQDFVKNVFVDHYITDENARIEVQNGSGLPGVAGQVVKSLEAAHYNVLTPLNAPDHYSTTVIYDYTGGKKPYTINYLERRFGVKASKAPSPSPSTDATGKTTPAPEIRIILGSDYKPANVSQ